MSDGRPLIQTDGPIAHPTAGDTAEAPTRERRDAWLVERGLRVVRASPRPFVMLGLLAISIALDAIGEGLGDPLAALVIAVGAAPLVRDTFVALREHRYALDYLALLAIAAAIAAHEFQVVG